MGGKIGVSLPFRPWKTVVPLLPSILKLGSWNLVCTFSRSPRCAFWESWLFSLIFTTLTAPKKWFFGRVFSFFKFVFRYILNALNFFRNKISTFIANTKSKIQKCYFNLLDVLTWSPKVSHAHLLSWILSNYLTFKTYPC